MALGAALLIIAACSSSPSAPSMLSLAGNWSGPGSNMLGSHTLSLTITQQGNLLSGTAVTQAADPVGTTCSSCHMNKMGTLSGTIEGTTVSLNMTFPSGNPAEPTPICSATMTINVTGITAATIEGPYTGSDTCEGQWTAATVKLTRQ